ncbi:MAG: hypothetical protein ACRCUY_02940 [Thermoguttaceae bacterium]
MAARQTTNTPPTYTSGSPNDKYTADLRRRLAKRQIHRRITLTARQTTNTPPTYVDGSPNDKYTADLRRRLAKRHVSTKSAKAFHRGEIRCIVVCSSNRPPTKTLPIN